MALTQEQINIVKSTAPVLKEHGQTITSTMYRNMLVANPEMKNVFSLRSQENGAQPAALAKALFAYATYIDDLGKLSFAVEHIAMKHVSLFIRPEQYAIVGKNLVAAFGQVLGDALTPEVKDAWIAAYNQLADVFIQREETLYKEMGDWQTWRKFEIVKKEPESNSVRSFYFKPVDGKPIPSYLPGQYVSVQVPVPQLGGICQSRQFSLSEAPGSQMEYYRVSVKNEVLNKEAGIENLKAGTKPGLISSILHDQYNVGDIVELSPPRGDFLYDDKAVSKDAPVVLLSAGVGATPVMSILQSLLLTKTPRPISWLHGARYSGSILFKKYAREAASQYDNVQARIFVKNVEADDKLGEDYDVVGRLDVANLEREQCLHLDNPTAQYYMCGPEAWMEQTKTWIQGKGVAPERTHTEVFMTGGF